MLTRIRELFASDSQAEVHGDLATPPGAEAGVPGTDFKLGEFSIDDYKPMKIIAIGAGMSGILAGIRFRQYISNLDLTIYEKEDNIGGTWHVNRYPGIACDVPSHVYQFTFENKSDWSALYSSGSEILEHLESIVSKYKLEPYIKLRHELTHARYDEATGKWHVRIKRPSATSDGQYEEFDDECDFLFMGVGLLSRWEWPDISGLKDYKGLLVHSANWSLGGAKWEEDVKEWGDKNVAVIGLGSSSLQIVAALQDKVGRLSQYARGKTWVAPMFARDKLAELLSRKLGDQEPENYKFSEEEKAILQDPVRAAEFRKTLDIQMNSMHSVNISGSELQQTVQVLFKEFMKTSLKEKPEIAEKLIPDFSVSCRRLTPAPGYLKALCLDHVDFITDNIKNLTADGIETVDGKHRKHDVIICATGFDVSFRYPFPVIGRNGVDLRDKWDPLPDSYLSVCTDGFPNCFFSCGPNSAIGTSSLLTMIEHQVDYAISVARKLQRERLKSIEVKAEAVKDFEEVVEGYFQRTVFTEKVKSWYKSGREDGRVTGLWPGSSLHCMRALRYPRWEDYNYERADSSKNRLYWLGDGMTHNEVTLSGNRAWFLDASYVDVPPVPQ